MLLGALCATAVASAVPACYTAGGGTAPPTNAFYFPVGLAVSEGGRVLYAVNSDFDLQWSGGTLQSYDLQRIRADALALEAYSITGDDQGIALPACESADAGADSGQAGAGDGGVASVDRLHFSYGKPPPKCKQLAPPGNTALGQGCAAPPVDSTYYVEDSKTVGAFATDLQIRNDRLFFPVRGTATLTWADVGNDDGVSCGAPFSLKCRPDSTGRCTTQAGSDPNSQDNTRHVTMPGEPFGMALTQDGTAVAITHQTDTKTSLLTSGIETGMFQSPTMQFVLDGLPQGGNGIAYVPHDYDALRVPDPNDPTKLKPGACDDPLQVSRPNADCVRPAFLETSRNVAELDLLRYYSDDNSVLPNGAPGAGLGETLQRPFLQRERAYTLTANSLGTDQRGIAIDPTPRYACKARLGKNPSPADLKACGQIAARVFFASRSPPSLVVGEIGELATDGSYDSDALVVTGNVSVDAGPSRVYVAPIIDSEGKFELRVFVVCFDSGAVFIYDPDDLATEGSNAVPTKVIYTGNGTGPFAMAFDPMPLECAAIADPKSDAWSGSTSDYPWKMAQCPSPAMSPLQRYRFGYIANFTQSFVQMVDLDDSSPFAPYTFEQIVFTLGKPTLPKGQ